MLDTTLKFAGRIGLILIIISGLTILGNTINNFLVWEYLIIFFSIIRNIGEIFSFIIDTDTLWKLVGYTIIIRIAILIFKVTANIANFFNEK